jgi:hypothetical protein
MAAIDLTAQRLREVVVYDELTGEFRWRGYRSGLSTYAKPVGWVNPDKGRRIVRIDGHTYRASRLAWLYVFGVWPSHEVDHIDGNKLNDAIANLRDVPRLLNEHNKKKANRRKRGGSMRGATVYGDRWQAIIRAEGTVHRLGVFASEQQAHAAYMAAKRRLHAGFVG